MELLDRKEYKGQLDQKDLKGHRDYLALMELSDLREYKGKKVIKVTRVT